MKMTTTQLRTFFCWTLHFKRQNLMRALLNTLIRSRPRSDQLAEDKYGEAPLEIIRWWAATAETYPNLDVLNQSLISSQSPLWSITQSQHQIFSHQLLFVQPFLPLYCPHLMSPQVNENQIRPLITKPLTSLARDPSRNPNRTMLAIPFGGMYWHRGCPKRHWPTSSQIIQHSYEHNTKSTTVQGLYSIFGRQSNHFRTNKKPSSSRVSKHSNIPYGWIGYCKYRYLSLLIGFDALSKHCFQLKSCKSN